MTRSGYTLMTEQNGPQDLVRNAVAAERVEHVASSIPCGGDAQQPFLAAAQERLLPALREAAPTAA